MINSRKNRFSLRVACMGEMRNIYKISVGKPEGNISYEISPLGRTRWGYEVSGITLSHSHLYT
jgi:hypothetical protein